MKNFIIGFYLLLSAQAFAAKPPGQSLVNQYVEMALKIEPKNLHGKKGAWTCSFAMTHDPAYFYASAGDMNVATTALQLLCIRDQCDKVGEKVNQSQNNLRNMTESDLRDFLEFQKYDASEIEKMVIQIKNSPPPTTTLNCATGTDQMRMFAFDSCFTVPVECRQN